MTWKRYDNWPNRLYSSVPRSNECIAQVGVDRTGINFMAIILCTSIGCLINRHVLKVSILGIGVKASSKKIHTILCFRLRYKITLMCSVFMNSEKRLLKIDKEPANIRTKLIIKSTKLNEGGHELEETISTIIRRT